MQQNEQTRYPVRAMMAILLLGGFLSLFNETILNVALSLIMSEMHVTATTVQWLSTGYVLVVAIMVPISAFLIHTFTTKQLYLGAMGLFWRERCWPSFLRLSPFFLFQECSKPQEPACWRQL